MSIDCDLCVCCNVVFSLLGLQDLTAIPSEGLSETEVMAYLNMLKKTDRSATDVRFLISGRLF